MLLLLPLSAVFFTLHNVGHPNLKVLEAKYVQNGDDGLDRFAGGLPADDLVEAGHQPGEQGRVEGLRYGVSRI